METKKPYKRYLLYSFFALFLLSGFSAHGTEPGLGGVESRRPLFLPAPDENEGADTREVQALKDGYEIVAYEEVLLGDTGKPGLGGVESRYPLFLLAPDQSESYDTKTIRK